MNSEVLLKLMKAHEESCRSRSNDLLREDVDRAKNEGAADAYGYVKLLLENPDIVEGLSKNIDSVVRIISRP